MMDRCQQALHQIYKLHLSKYCFEMTTDSFIRMLENTVSVIAAVTR